MQKIEEIRRARLRVLIDEAGSQAKLSEKIQKAPAQISQWVNASKDAKSKKPRAMDSSTARALEAACGKPEGWMDQPVSQKTVSLETRLLEAYRNADDVGRELILRAAGIAHQLGSALPQINTDKRLSVSENDYKGSESVERATDPVKPVTQPQYPALMREDEKLRGEEQQDEGSKYNGGPGGPGHR